MDLSDPPPSMLDASVVSRPGAGSSRTSALDVSAPPSADLVPQLISPIVWQLSFPVLIVDASRRLLYGNHAGRTLLEAGQALVLRGERLDCVSAGDRARLDRALQSCFGVRGGPGGIGGSGGSGGDGRNGGPGGPGGHCGQGDSCASAVTSFCLAPCGGHAPLTVSV